MESNYAAVITMITNYFLQKYTREKVTIPNMEEVETRQCLTFLLEINHQNCS